jgi:hypothetical protein
MQGRAPPRRGARASAAAGGASTSSRASDVNSSLPSHVAAAWEVLVKAAPRLAEVPDANGRLPSAPSLEELVAFQDAAATLSSYAELAASCVELWRDQRIVRTLLLLFVAGSPTKPAMQTSRLGKAGSSRSKMHSTRCNGLTSALRLAGLLVSEAKFSVGYWPGIFALQRGMAATQLAERYARGAAEPVERLLEARGPVPPSVLYAYSTIHMRGGLVMSLFTDVAVVYAQLASEMSYLRRSNVAAHISRLVVALMLKRPAASGETGAIVEEHI